MMPGKQRTKAQRKLEELDVLGALDNLLELADAKGGGSKRSRLERARLRMVQTIAIAASAAVSIILITAIVMSMLRDNWSRQPQAPATPAAVQTQSRSQAEPRTGNRPQANPASQAPVAENTPPALTPEMQKWAYATTAQKIAQLWLARDGGVYLKTLEGNDYTRIEQLSAKGVSVAQFGYEIGSLGDDLGLDSAGCSYFLDRAGCAYYCELDRLRKFDFTGKQLWEQKPQIFPSELLAPPGGGLLVLGGRRDTPAEAASKTQGGPSGMIVALGNSGAERWRYVEQQNLWHMLVGPDGSVYFFAAPSSVEHEGDNSQRVQDEPAHFCHLGLDGKLKWRFDLSFARMICNTPDFVTQQVVFTSRGDVLLPVVRASDYARLLLLIDSATGKQLQSLQTSYACNIGAAADGTVYGIDHAKGLLYAMNDKLAVKWQQALSSRATQPPLVFPDSSVCIVGQKTLCGFNSSGKLLYDIALPDVEGPPCGTPAAALAGPHGMVYLPRGGKLLAFQHRDWRGAQE